MNYSCAFSKNHKCPMWTDYIVTRPKLEEADELCHGNWIEIQRKTLYIEALQRILDQNNLPYPEEFDF